MTTELPPTTTKKAAKLRAKIIAKIALKDWRDSGEDACAVCGEMSHVKRDSAGDVMHSKHGRPIRTRIEQHHILDRKNYPDLRTNPMNRIALCYRHHKAGKYSAHRNGIWFANWLATNRPGQWAWAITHIGAEIHIGADAPGK